MPSYNPPRVWPDVGADLGEDALALIAVTWIYDNADYLLDYVRRRMSAAERARGWWEPADVVSRLAYRAARGAGLTAANRHHVRGTKPPVEDQHGLLCAHTMWVVGEQRKAAAVLARFEVLTDGGKVRDWPSAAMDVDASADVYYLGLIDALGCEDWAHVVQHREKALWSIFCRFVPADVVAAVAGWPEDERRCVLLGVFPLQLPHQLIAHYRQLCAGLTPGGVRTPDSTRKTIARLRRRLVLAWPVEQLPRHLKRFAVPHQRGGTA